MDLACPTGSGTGSAAGGVSVARDGGGRTAGCLGSRGALFPATGGGATTATTGTGGGVHGDAGGVSVEVGVFGAFGTGGGIAATGTGGGVGGTGGSCVSDRGAVKGGGGGGTGARDAEGSSFLSPVTGLGSAGGGDAGWAVGGGATGSFAAGGGVETGGTAVPGAGRAEAKAGWAGAPTSGTGRSADTPLALKFFTNPDSRLLPGGRTTPPRGSASSGGSGFTRERILAQKPLPLPRSSEGAGGGSGTGEGGGASDIAMGLGIRAEDFQPQGFAADFIQRTLESVRLAVSADIDEKVIFPFFMHGGP